MKLFGSLVIAFSMYSRIPMPEVEWTKGRMRYALCFFPLVGAVTGILVFGAFKLLLGLSFFRLAAVVPVLLPLLINGGIHLDGFMDVSDALASHGECRRKLEIMKDPHIGAFAAIALVVYMVLYIAAFGELKGELMPAFAATFVITRAFSAFGVVCLTKARRDGLAVAFSEEAEKKTMTAAAVFYTMAAEAVIWFFCGFMIAAAVLLVSTAVFVWYRHMALKEFGGVTGDLAGYFLQICELALLLTLVFVSRLYQ